MIQKALIAVKGSSEAPRLARATALLCPRPATVDVVHVVEDEGSDGYLRGRDIGTEVLDHLRARGIDAGLHVLAGLGDPVPERLAREVRERGAELIVMGSRGLGRLSSLLHGSVSHALLARSGAAALVVPDRATLPHERVDRALVAVGDDRDMDSVALALLALPARPQLVVVHVRHLVAAHAGHIEVPETSTHLLESACMKLHRLGFAVKASQLSTHGQVAVGVALSAREAGADLVVVASRRPGDWTGLINGSVGHDLLHHADRMVLMAPVHPGAGQGEPR